MIPSTVAGRAYTAGPSWARTLRILRAIPRLLTSRIHETPPELTLKEVRCAWRITSTSARQDPIGSGAYKDRISLARMRFAARGMGHSHSCQHVVPRSETVSQRLADLLTGEVSPGHRDRGHYILP